MEKQRQRAFKVYGLLDKPQTNFEMTTQLFERIYQQQLGLTLSETLGQFDYLVDQGMVEMVHYYKKS